jgi:16S rRNA (cytidine1402-2'-O)-methyltransferase
VFRGAISEAIAHFTEPRGEFTLVFAGAAAGSQGGVGATLGSPVDVEAAAREELLALKRAGRPAKTAVPEVAKRRNLPRRAVYRTWLELP